MAEGRWACIRQNYVFISNKLYLSEELLRYLYQESLVSRHDLECLRNVHEPSSTRLNHLLDLLGQQPDSKFDTFCRCLRLSGQGHVADVLVHADKGMSIQSKVEMPRGHVSTYNVQSGPPSLSLCSPVVTSEHIEIMKNVIGVDWIPFGRVLLKFSASQVRDIVSPYASEQLRDSEKAYYVLDFWKQKEGMQATVERLLEACDKVNKRGAAEVALNLSLK